MLFLKKFSRHAWARCHLRQRLSACREKIHKLFLKLVLTNCGKGGIMAGRWRPLCSLATRNSSIPHQPKFVKTFLKNFLFFSVSQNAKRGSSRIIWAAPLAQVRKMEMGCKDFSLHYYYSKNFLEKQEKFLKKFQKKVLTFLHPVV